MCCIDACQTICILCNVYLCVGHIEQFWIGRCFHFRLPTHTHTQPSAIYRKSMTTWVLCGRSSGQQRQWSSYIVCILIEADGKFSDTNKYLTLAANLCWDLILILTYYIVREQRCYSSKFQFQFRAIIFVMIIKRCGMKGNKWKSAMSRVY